MHVRLEKILRKLEVEQVEADEPNLNFAEKFLRVKSIGSLLHFLLTYRMVERRFMACTTGAAYVGNVELCILVRISRRSNGCLIYSRSWVTDGFNMNTYVITMLSLDYV